MPNRHWVYTLVGDGPQWEQLHQLAVDLNIADRVIFTGRLPFAAVQQVYSASHVVIMPGTKEGWPKIIAEAWAHGCIPVAARAGIVPAIITQESGVGEIFDPCPEALGRALARILSAPEELPRLSQIGLDHVRSFSLEQFRRGLERVLSGLFARSAIRSGKAIASAS